MRVQKTITVTVEQDEWLEANFIRLSKVVQKWISEQMEDK